MPKGVARLITSIQRRFLWVGVSIERNICKVAWQVLFKGRKKERWIGYRQLFARKKQGNAFLSGFGD